MSLNLGLQSKTQKNIIFVYVLFFPLQAPEEFNEGEEPLNKGHVYLTNTSLSIVYKAYFEQFQRDFKLFLSLRSDELTPNGNMILTLLGRENALFEMSSSEALIELVLKDMVLEVCNEIQFLLLYHIRFSRT